MKTIMKTRVAAAIAALVIGATAPASSALAFPYDAPRGHYTGFASEGVETTGAIGFYGSRNPATCAMSSAAEGNARQQNFPVQQYGQTSGGNRC